VGRIRAVSFDLWDTIIQDDSDEPKRLAQGLRSKREARRHLVWQALERHQPTDPGLVDRAYDTADAAFNRVWHDQHVTWPIRTRLEILLAGLGRELPEAELAALVEAHEVMELEVRPDAITGIEAALRDLARRYKLCVTSDAIVSPGRVLRQLLDGHGLARYFSGFAFSDEVGRSKPHPEMFRTAARELGVAPEEIVHVGDRDHNDVKGPQALGMKAVLFAGSRDHDRAATSADAVVDRMADLPAAIDRLNDEV
jgi:putative hydrolase of the HAD superfamily